MRERLLRFAVAAAAFASAAFVSQTAKAAPCSDGTDALNLARRARKTFYDFAQIERTYTLDKELSYASIAAGEAYFAKPEPYLDDERQTYSVIGAGYGAKDRGPRIGLDGAVEYSDPRFRYARVRGDLGFGKMLPWFYVGAGIDLSVSIFNSRYLYEQTSKQMVPDIAFGAHRQFSSGPFAFGCEISVLTNRPELMSVFVQSVDSVAATVSAFVRISPPI
ncbi:MAG: hypothetical protein ABI461_16440 [Polyangiaceae bacterium]